MCCTEDSNPDTQIPRLFGNHHALTIILAYPRTATSCHVQAQISILAMGRLGIGSFILFRPYKLKNNQINNVSNVSIYLLF